MNAIQKPERACPSRLRFDRLLAGELDPAHAAQLTAHATGCVRCGELLAELRRGHAAFGASAALPDAVVQRVSEGRGVVAWPRWTAPVLAAAAALLAWSAWPRSLPGMPSFGERSKGSAVQLAFYVLHDGTVRPGADGERVQPGDQLEFAYTSEREAYLAIVSIDAARKASAYYAKDGYAAKILPARRAVLDQSTLLDATLGHEWVYSLVCMEPVAVAPILEALERSPEAVPSVASCTVERHALLKVPR
jgi:hypothetical protein